MQSMTPQQTYELMRRFPDIELSYETIPHRKVSAEYDMCLGIPVGKKCLLWYTFYVEEDVCFLIELTREKKPGNMFFIETLDHEKKAHSLAYGSVFHGTWIDASVGSLGMNSAVHVMAATANSASPVFLIDDVLMYKGMSTKQMLFSEKLGFLSDYFAATSTMISDQKQRQSPIQIAMTSMWPSLFKQEENECVVDIPKDHYYPVHHVQYRALNSALPYLNITPVRNSHIVSNAIATSNRPTYNFKETNSLLTFHNPSLHKPQYKSPTVFVVKADLQFDIYHLYAYGKGKELVYCGICYIANYKTSVFMNGIFRKIKENACLDAIEESDDEEDFENTEVDKYVDLEKQLNMECMFHSKFKKWVPKKVVDGKQKVVHISML